MPTPPPIRVLHLVRHGSFHADPVRDTGLNERGRTQARTLAPRLATLGSVPITSILHSDLARAVETAELLAEALPGIKRRASSALAEGFPSRPPRPEGLPPDADDAFFAAEAARFEKAVAMLLRPVRKTRAELVVSHGNWIRGLVARALGLPPTSWTRFQIHHASLTTIGISPTEIVVIRVNDVGHFPPALVTLR